MSDEVDRGNEEVWRSLLLGMNRFIRFGHAAFSHLPSPPRCEICAAFKGPFTPVLRVLGRAPFPKNPRYCNLCIGRLMRNKGGAEVELTPCSPMFVARPRWRSGSAPPEYGA